MKLDLFIPLAVGKSTIISHYRSPALTVWRAQLWLTALPQAETVIAPVSTYAYAAYLHVHIIYIYIYMYVCMYVYAYIHTYIHVCLMRSTACNESVRTLRLNLLYGYLGGVRTKRCQSYSSRGAFDKIYPPVFLLCPVIAFLERHTTRAGGRPNYVEKHRCYEQTKMLRVKQHTKHTRALHASYAAHTEAHLNRKASWRGLVRLWPIHKLRIWNFIAKTMANPQTKD